MGKLEILVLVTSKTRLQLRTIGVKGRHRLLTIHHHDEEDLSRYSTEINGIGVFAKETCT